MRDATRLDMYFKDDKALFQIPLYQRKYSWQDKHCVRLFNDLLKVHRQALPSHFFGCIVSIRESQVDDDLLIIDGQQRLTTVSLIILAGINAVKNGCMKCENEEFTKDTFEKYLLAKYRKGVERKIKLCPIEEDRVAYDKLFTNEEAEFVSPAESTITSNYLLFYQLINDVNEEMTFEDLITAISKLIIIDIRLESQDNPQLIFESLNSCGKDLEEADKVRNYLLMTEKKSVQVEYYRNYWHKIEKNTDGKPTMFIRDYLTIKKKSISSLEEQYFEFKEYCEENDISREEMLRDMLKYSVFYRVANKGETGDEKIDRKLHQLASIGSNVCMPFYMMFLDYAKTNNLSVEVCYEVFDVIENYWARRIICALPANAMNKIFALLHSDVMRIFNEHESKGREMTVSYAEVMKMVILRKQGTGEFPNDKTVSEMFPQRQIYKIHPAYRTFLFERMENLNSKEYNETIIEKINKGEISIEHIMPQHLTAQWRNELGTEADEIHDKYLHTFANLTLTAYNPEYSNRPYNEKRSGYTVKRKNKETKKEEEIHVEGFIESRYSLSDYMKTHDNWGKEELEERGQILLKRFLSLWPMITSDYEPLEDEHDIVSLDDDDVELTGRKIAGYRFRGVYHDVQNWKEMLVQVCKALYAEKPIQLLQLASKANYMFVAPRSDTSMIAERCHVWSSSSTKSKRSVLLHIFEELNISPSELEIVLLAIDDNATDDTDEENSSLNLELSFPPVE